MTALETTIGALFAAGKDANKDDARKAFFELQRGLNAGEVRAAEPDSTSPTGWRVNVYGEGKKRN